MIQTSNFGEAVYPFLSSPDTHFKTEGEYHVKLKVKKADAQEDIKKIQEVISKEVAEEHKKKPGNTQPLKRAPLPYKEEGDFVIFHFKMKASGTRRDNKKTFTQSPVLMDAELKPLGHDVQIWGDSILRITFEPHSYSMPVGLGCTLRLKTVQVLELVTGKATNTLGELKVEPMVAPVVKTESETPSNHNLY